MNKALAFLAVVFVTFLAVSLGGALFAMMLHILHIAGSSLSRLTGGLISNSIAASGLFTLVMSIAVAVAVTLTSTPGTTPKKKAKR